MDFERAFGFLTQNQAELSAKIGEVSDRLVAITDNLTVQGALLARLETAVNANTAHIATINEAIVALVASDQRLQKKIDATEERVNALISTVERLIDRRNGKSEA